MSENRIDTWFERQVDRLVIRVPAFFRLLGIRISVSHLGWHLCLLLVSIRDAIAGLFVHIRSEDDMDLFLSDTAESLQGQAGFLRNLLVTQGEWLLAIDSAGARLRFITQLFLLALVTCGCVFTGNWETAAIASAICLCWCATAFEIEYPPLVGPVRQRYLVSRVLAAFSFVPPMLFFYIRYRDRGVANNMMLQGMMLFMLMTHLVLFTVLVAPNRRQSLFLRLLAAILGIFPSLMVATIIAYSATQMGLSTESFIKGFLRILGGVLFFISDRLETLYALGSIRLRFSAFWLWLSNTLGLLFLIAAAW